MWKRQTLSGFWEEERRKKQEKHGCVTLIESGHWIFFGVFLASNLMFMGKFVSKHIVLLAKSL